MRTPAQFLVGLVLLFSVFALHRTVHAADATVTILWRDDGSASGSPSASTFTTNINFYVQNVGARRPCWSSPKVAFGSKKGRRWCRWIMGSR